MTGTIDISDKKIVFKCTEIIRDDRGINERNDYLENIPTYREKTYTLTAYLIKNEIPTNVLIGANFYVTSIDGRENLETKNA